MFEWSVSLMYMKKKILFQLKTYMQAMRGVCLSMTVALHFLPSSMS